MYKENDEISLNKKAWSRYFARIIDMTVGITIIGIIVGISLNILNFYGSAIHIPDILMTVLLSIIYLLIEPIMISKFGTTPSKKLFGISIISSNNEYLNYSISMQRGFFMWAKGLAFTIPIISLIALSITYSNFTNEGVTSWDKSCDAKVIHKKISKFRFIIGIILWILTVVFNILMISS